MSYYAWNQSKSLCGMVGGGVVCKPFILFSLAQAEQKENHQQIKMFHIFTFLESQNTLVSH